LASPVAGICHAEAVAKFRNGMPGRPNILDKLWAIVKAPWLCFSNQAIIQDIVLELSRLAMAPHVSGEIDLVENLFPSLHVRLQTNPRGRNKYPPLPFLFRLSNRQILIDGSPFISLPSQNFLSDCLSS
jgi:hypothetical protein